MTFRKVSLYLCSLFLILALTGLRDYRQRAGVLASSMVSFPITTPDAMGTDTVGERASGKALKGAKGTEIPLIVENLHRLFQPKIMLDGGYTSGWKFISTIETCPPVNLNFDGNWDFNDTPSSIRLQMLNRPESFRKLHLTGGTVYYRTARFSKLTISHQYWYYFPVGKGRYMGTADQRIGLVEVVQVMPDKGLWGRKLTPEDLEVESVYVAGCLRLKDLTGHKVKKYLPHDIEWAEFRPVVYVEKGVHTFFAQQNRTETWEDLKGKHSQSLSLNEIDWFTHPEDSEKVINLSHNRDWNNPFRHEKNVNNFAGEGSFWELALYTVGAAKTMMSGGM